VGAGQQTVIQGHALYALPNGEFVDIPMSVSVRLTDDGDRIEDARIFIDPAPLAQASAEVY